MSAEHQMRARLARQHAPLLALARRLVNQDEVAQDAVQDTLQAALEQPREPRSLSAWLQQVLRNRVRGEHRRRQIEERRLRLVVEPDPRDDPADRLEHVRWLGALQTALDELAQPYQSVVIRRFFDGLTPTQIAQADGDPPATIRWRIHEGLRRLRAQLDERHGNRAWCAAFVALPGGKSMSTPMTIKAAAVLAVLGVSATVAAIEPQEEAEPAGSAAAQPSVEPPMPRAPMAAAERSASLSVDPSALHETAPDPPARADPIELISDALNLCIEDLGATRLRGLPRLELDMYTWTLPGGETQIERIDLTTGRALMLADGVDESTPVDHPDVTRHDELADCLAYTLDLERFPPTRDALGRIAATTHHMHGPRGVVLELDARGHVARRPEAEPLNLPEVGDEDGADPENAVSRLDVPVLGQPWEAATVRIVECGSYSCPFCRRSEATVAAIRSERDDVAFAFMTMPIDAAGVLLATAAVAAERQGRAWETHRALFEAQPTDRREVIALAETLELDVERFAADLDEAAVLREVARRRRVCRAAGARATPTFFVNGDLLSGEVGEAQMLAAIEDVLDGS